MFQKYPRFQKGRVCVVCGAKIRYDRYKANTCDPVCTRAKHNKVSRYEQGLADKVNPWKYYPKEHLIKPIEPL